MPSNSHPDWWQKNEQLRSELGLPPYEPPRFSDGIYVHNVIPELEEQCNCEIRLIGRDTRYGDEWRVEADGELLFEIGRSRTKSGNTVYECSAETFRSMVAESMPGV